MQNEIAYSKARDESRLGNQVVKQPTTKASLNMADHFVDVSHLASIENIELELNQLFVPLTEHASDD